MKVIYPLVQSSPRLTVSRGWPAPNHSLERRLIDGIKSSHLPPTNEIADVRLMITTSSEQCESHRFRTRIGTINLSP